MNWPVDGDDQPWDDSGLRFSVIKSLYPLVWTDKPAKLE